MPHEGMARALVAPGLGLGGLGARVMGAQDSVDREGLEAPAF